MSFQPVSKFNLFLSAFTAFCISAGGCLVVVVGSGAKLNEMAWTLSTIVGIVSAAKDVRSVLQFPPVSDTNTNTNQWRRQQENQQENDKNKNESKNT